MKTRIISIGNSQGIRIPNMILEQSGLGEEVELDVQDAQIVIPPAKHPRQRLRSMRQRDGPHVRPARCHGGAQGRWHLRAWPRHPPSRFDARELCNTHIYYDAIGQEFA
jgi:antitoxin MazE